jgi:hypothetical protein
MSTPISAGASYTAPDVLLLANTLVLAGWRRGGLKAPTEAGRLWKAGALVLISLSGAVVIGGRCPWIATDALEQLTAEPVGAQLSLWDCGVSHG